MQVDVIGAEAEEHRGIQVLLESLRSLLVPAQGGVDLSQLSEYTKSSVEDQLPSREVFLEGILVPALGQGDSSSDGIDARSAGCGFPDLCIDLGLVILK